MGRPYTGFDVIAGGKRAGFETFIDLLEAHFGLWNNGTFGVRKKRGKSSYSVHATGRAGDLSWRGAPYRGPGNYEAACKMMDFLAANADALFVEAIFDYYPAPHGRGWKCDRGGWQVYDKPAFSGAPGGDWVHVEVSNDKADDPQYYIDTMKRLLGDSPVPPAPAPAKKTASAPPGKKPWLQVGSKGAAVKKVQELVGADPADGDYGRKTEAAVKAYQAEHDLHVDGIWGPGSDKHSKNCTCKPAEVKAEDVSPAPVTPTAKAAFPGTMKRGTRGEQVKQVQSKVGATPDGWYGPATERRVKEWQKANGLTVDGVIGPKTFAAMFG